MARKGMKWLSLLGSALLLAGCGDGIPSDKTLQARYPDGSFGDTLETVDSQVDCPVPAFLFGEGPQLARGIALQTGVVNPDGGLALHRWGQWHYFYVDPEEIYRPGYASRKHLAARGEFRDGQRVGIWEFWFPGYELRARGAFVDGRMDGEWEVRSGPGVPDPEHSGLYVGGVKQ